MSDRFPAALDRHSLVAFVRCVLARADALDRGALHCRRAAPAGLPLELWFDESAQAELNAPRLAGSAGPAHARPTRLYVLSAASLGEARLPVWDDASCDAGAFHALLGAAGLRAAYPVREQEWLALDPEAGLGVQLARAHADLPDWFTGAPLRQHLHWLLRARGDRLAHAASLGLDGRGILLLGHGGAGKSATALAGLAAGLQTVGDDYVALGGIEPALMRPLYRIVKQDRAGLERLGGPADRLSARPENWRGKVEFDPEALFPGCFAEALRVAAIVLPQMVRAPVPRILPAGAGEAMRALMRTNLYQFPGEPEDGLEYYAGLLRTVPVHRIELSERAQDNGAALADFVAALR